MEEMEVLVASSDAETRTALANILGQFGMTPLIVVNVDEVRTALTRLSVDLVFCDESLPGGGFHQVLRLTKAVGSGVPLVVSSWLGDLDEYLEAMRMGVFDFIAPPYRHIEVESIVKSAYQARPSRKTVAARPRALLEVPISRNEEAVA
jgi:DNA-binding NtrC family response regulator